MRCDQCEFWGESADTWETGEIGFKRCNAVKMRWVIADGAHAGEKHPNLMADAEGAKKWAAERSEALRTARAFVEDSSEYYAALFTGPDFGCALFKQK